MDAFLSLKILSAFIVLDLITSTISLKLQLKPKYSKEKQV